MHERPRVRPFRAVPPEFGVWRPRSSSVCLERGAPRADTPSQAVAGTATTSPTPPPPPPKHFFPGPSPGSSGAGGPRPALAVKIEASTLAPQTGAECRDISCGRGGRRRITIARFHSTLPPDIGSSGPAIAAPLRGLLAFSGGDPSWLPSPKRRPPGGQQQRGAAGFYRSASAPHKVNAHPAAFLAQPTPVSRVLLCSSATRRRGSTRPRVRDAPPPQRGGPRVNHPRWTWDGRRLAPRAAGRGARHAPPTSWSSASRSTGPRG